MAAQRRNVIRRLFARKPGTASDEAGRSQGLEIGIAVILGIAAMMTAFAALKTELANGDTLKAFQDGSAAYGDANQQYLEGNQQVANDVGLFTQYAIAVEEGKGDLAEYIKTGLMDGSLPDATDEWVNAEGDLPSPIEADSYEVKPYDEAERLVADGDDLFDKANTKDKEGDRFTLASVILAVALFFGGVAGVTRSHLISVAMTVFSAVLLLGTGAYMFTI